MIVKYIVKLLKHKWFVFLAGIKLGGIGIIRLLLHDISKFSLREFIPYARYPFGGEPTQKQQADFDIAWNYHQKTNKHHFQMWILINDEDGTYPLPMPKIYIREMVADWMGASRAYAGSWIMVDWMNQNLMNYAKKMHKETIDYLWEVLHELGYVDSGGDGWYYRP